MLALSRQILISAPKDSVQLYLRDLKNMAEYEQKVERVDVAQEETGGFVEVQGKFLGLPWRGAFKMEFTRDGGFRSEMVRGPLAKMVGGFHLRPVTGGTILTHDEQYHFPALLRPLTYLFRGWLTRSIDLELGVIKEGAERLHRRLQLQRIEQAL
jgi:hypothetical protein